MHLGVFVSLWLALLLQACDVLGDPAFEQKRVLRQLEVHAIVIGPGGIDPRHDDAQRSALSVIVARVDATGPDHYGMHFQLPENAFLFKRWIAGNIKGSEE